MATKQERLAALMAEMDQDELAEAKSAVASKVSEAKARQGKEAKETAAAAIKADVTDSLPADVPSGLIERVRNAMVEPGLKKTVITITADELTVTVPIGASSNGSTGDRVMSYTRRGPESRNLRRGYVRLLQAVSAGNDAPWGVTITLKEASVRGFSVITGLGSSSKAPYVMGSLTGDVDDTDSFREGPHGDSLWRVIKNILSDAGATFANAQDLDVQLNAAVDQFESA
jgi:hypothetical protein